MNINFWLSIILLFSFESLCAQEGSESIPKLIQQKQYTEAISLCDQTILKTNEPNEKGIEKGIESRNFSFVKTLLEETDFDDAKIARLASVNMEYVQKLCQQLGK